MVIGGGHRSDVIRNMTLEEWNDRKIEEGEDEENQVPGNSLYMGKLWSLQAAGTVQNKNAVQC